LQRALSFCRSIGTHSSLIQTFPGLSPRDIRSLCFVPSYVLPIHLSPSFLYLFLSCVDPKRTLGIKLPFLVMIIKNLKKYFTFEVQVLDDKNVRRRFRASNYQSTTRVKPFICTMPMRLDEGWNQIQVPACLRACLLVLVCMRVCMCAWC